MIGLLLLNTFAASPTKGLQPLDLRTSPLLSLQHVPERALALAPLAQAARRRPGTAAGRQPGGEAGGGALRIQDLKRVTVDTTVQPKAISLPTDARLLHAAIRAW